MSDKFAVGGWAARKLDKDGIPLDLWFNQRLGEFKSEPLATLFGSKEAAESYCAEFGLEVGRDCEVIEHGF